MNTIIRKEIAGLSKNRLLKLRADVNGELKDDCVLEWTRSVPNCEDISCGKCDLENACNFTEGSDYENNLFILLQEIKAEIARR